MAGELNGLGREVGLDWVGPELERAALVVFKFKPFGFERSVGTRTVWKESHPNRHWYCHYRRQVCWLTVGSWKLGLGHELWRFERWYWSSTSCTDDCWRYRGGSIQAPERERGRCE